ncbi:S1C family serine protease [Mycobacterium lepromatosis]|uniref:S1C family serine protease n=1 Tax=Mycobacterium lepromatosis TaxID=480418 RepID=UPI000AF355AE|nr:S1C family serine protease [Mycobacterium lepromatosis]
MGCLQTSVHVVPSACSAEATFPDGTVVYADVAGRDALSDLAVLKESDSVPASVRHGTRRGLTRRASSGWWLATPVGADPAASSSSPVWDGRCPLVVASSSTRPSKPKPR